jgi:aminopeptidase YwaD
MKLAWMLLLSAPLAAQSLAAPAPAPLDPALRDLFHESLSGELAKEHVIAITRHHRIQGSRGYREAARYVIGQLRTAGFVVPDLPDTLEAFLDAGDFDGDTAAVAAAPDAGGRHVGGALAGDPPAAWIESFPSDGRAVYQTWQSPSGWDIREAELRLLSPAAPGGERIVGYPEIAMSVITYSSVGDVTSPLVWVGRGDRAEDYAGKDVKGKFVLATGYGGAVHRLAVLQHGAAAVVCFLDDERAADHPDMLAYTGMWPRTAELERTTFGFNLTNRQGTRLRDMLLAGQDVQLRGWVKGRGLEPYWMDLVLATIPGSGPAGEEVVFTAHLDHPKESANDNASGSAAILDIACTLKRLIDSGRLPRPARTLRFLWVPEWNGTMAYIDAHPEFTGPGLGGPVVAGLNMDMVGENLELLHSRLILTRTPDSLPSPLDDLVGAMAQMVDDLDIRTPRGGSSTFNWRLTPYSGGSDHMMLIDRKIPAVMFSHAPDYTHHTSEDTPDKVDPVELERCELIATGAAWRLANPDDALAQQLLALVEADGAARLARTTREKRGSVWIVGELWEAERTSVASLVPGTLVPSYPPPVSPGDAGLLEEPSTAATPELYRVPTRLTRGPLDFGLPESKLPPERAAFYSGDGSVLNGDVRFEAINFTDGLRTLVDLSHLLEAEFGREVPASVLSRYFDDLKTVGATDWLPGPMEPGGIQVDAPPGR